MSLLSHFREDIFSTAVTVFHHFLGRSKSKKLLKFAPASF